MKNSDISALRDVLLLITVALLFYIFYNWNFKPDQPVKLPPNETAALPQEVAGRPNQENPGPKSVPALKLISKDDYLKYKNKALQSLDAEYYVSDEEYFLGKYPKVVRLNERCLEITIETGNKKNLCNDENQDTWPAISYHFSGYIPNFGYWFYIQLYEGSSGLLIDEKTGEEIPTFEKPLVSPNGKQFLTTSEDIFAEYNENGFEVWGKEGDNYTLNAQYLVNPGEHYENLWGVSGAVWVDEHSFYFIKRSASSEPTPNNYYKDEYAEFSF